MDIISRGFRFDIKNGERVVLTVRSRKVTFTQLVFDDDEGSGGLLQLVIEHDGVKSPLGHVSAKKRECDFNYELVADETCVLYTSTPGYMSHSNS